MMHTSQGFQAGDILVACDNELNIPTGYLGHSGIAINDQYMIEAVMTYPYIQFEPISQFATKHPKHAVYRPNDPQIGRAAAQFALWYYNQSQANHQNGVVIPPFSFSPQIPLSDLWTSVYCSKLVWLSYYYGAGYPLNNDYFLFTPEDIQAILSDHPHFTEVYKHPEFQFLLDT